MELIFFQSYFFVKPSEMHSSPVGSSRAVGDSGEADTPCSLMTVNMAACASLTLLSVVLWFLFQQGNDSYHPAARMSRTRVPKLSMRWVGLEDGHTSLEVTAIQEGVTL